MSTKTYHRCDSCKQLIEDAGVELSEPYDVQDDGSYRVTILNMDVPCKSCGGRLFAP